MRLSRRTYARGRNAIAECQRSGQKMRYRDLVEDGDIPGLLVHPGWWEPQHPQEIPVTVTDPVALWRPAPEISIPPGEGNIENPDGGTSPTEYRIIDNFNRTAMGANWLTANLAGYSIPVIRNTDWTGPAGAGAGNYFTFHADSVASRNLFAEAIVTDWVSGDYEIVAYLSLRHQTLSDGTNQGYYASIQAGTAMGNEGMILGLYRWDYIDGANAYTQLANNDSLNPSGVIPNGTVLRFEVNGNNLRFYYNGQLAVEATDGTYINQSQIGFGVESTGVGDGGFTSIVFGSFDTTEGTIAQTLTGGETQVLISDAVRLQAWNSRLFIALDGGGYHVTRIADGFASRPDEGPVFALKFITPFPAGSTATSGNAFQLGSYR